MKNNPIVIMDSGIGGLTVLKTFLNNYAHENYVYLCDKKNMPYGNKSNQTIKKLCLKNLKKALSFNPKLIVVACNTMSLIGREIFEKNSTVPVFFIKPNVKKMMRLGLKNCLLICTVQSAKSPDISRLSNICSDCVVSLPNLASTVEIGKGEIDEQTLKKLQSLIKGKRYVFLGCTHYIFFKKQLKNFAKDTIFFDGTEKIYKKPWDFCPLTNVAQKSCIKFVGSGKKNAKSVFFKIDKLL